ncbi:hypothetical protein EVAR_38633_1 [Eumeta japonica]|uniref:Uncharacterized protein n=1 Tax=Eumeta variegata TaxID=151549 RepID=A0A4C1Y1H1_EUMVA|nr:hypothetical protein EVAR_38633_1 [Eumeta japonica]
MSVRTLIAGGAPVYCSATRCSMGEKPTLTQIPGVPRRGQLPTPAPPRPAPAPPRVKLANGHTHMLEVIDALPASWVGIRYLMNGVMERRLIYSHSLDEKQQRKLVFHVCVLAYSNKTLSISLLSDNKSRSRHKSRYDLVTARVSSLAAPGPARSIMLIAPLYGRIKE